MAQRDRSRVPVCQRLRLQVFGQLLHQSRCASAYVHIKGSVREPRR